jgi:hypothetical protein
MGEHYKNGKKVSNKTRYSHGSSLGLPVDSIQYVNEYLGFKSSGKFYDYKNNYPLMKVNSAHLSETEHKKHIQGASLP